MESSFPRNIFLREIGDRRCEFQHIKITRLQALDKLTSIRSLRDIPAYASQFCARADSDHLALAYEDGSVSFRHAMMEVTHQANFTQIHKNTIFDLCWVPGEHRILTASGDETSILLDVEDGSPKVVREFKGHVASVRRVAACPDSPALFATGGRDGRIIMWDVRSSQAEDSIVGAHRSGTMYVQSSSVMDLKYIDTHKLISCGNADNSIKVWDLRKTHSIRNKPKSCFSLHNPTRNKMFLDIITDPAGGRFYATSSCNNIYEYKYYSALPERRYEGATCNSSFVRTCLSPGGEYLLSGSLDFNAYIWSTKHSAKKSVEPLVRLTGHSEVVTAVSWASIRDEPLIVTCSDDNRELVWAMECDDVRRMELSSIGGMEILNYPVCKPLNRGYRIMLPPNFVPAEENTPAKLVPAEERSTPLNTMTPPQQQTPECRQLFPDSEPNGSNSKPAPFLQNLPNFIVDGVSPRNVVSPVPLNLKENIDWLTQIRNNSGSEEKPRLPRSSSKKNSNGPTSGKKRKGKSLLQYFPKVPKNDGV